MWGIRGAAGGSFPWSRGRAYQKAFHVENPAPRRGRLTARPSGKFWIPIPMAKFLKKAQTDPFVYVRGKAQPGIGCWEKGTIKDSVEELPAPGPTFNRIPANSIPHQLQSFHQLQHQPMEQMRRRDVSWEALEGFQPEDSRELQHSHSWHLEQHSQVRGGLRFLPPGGLCQRGPNSHRALLLLFSPS